MKKKLGRRQNLRMPTFGGNFLCSVILHGVGLLFLLSLPLFRSNVNAGPTEVMVYLGSGETGPISMVPAAGARTPRPAGRSIPKSADSRKSVSKGDDAVPKDEVEPQEKTGTPPVEAEKAAEQEERPVPEAAGESDSTPETTESEDKVTPFEEDKKEAQEAAQAEAEKVSEDTGKMVKEDIPVPPPVAAQIPEEEVKLPAPEEQSRELIAAAAGPYTEPAVAMPAPEGPKPEKEAAKKKAAGVKPALKGKRSGQRLKETARAARVKEAETQAQSAPMPPAADPGSLISPARSSELPSEVASPPKGGDGESARTEAAGPAAAGNKGTEGAGLLKLAEKGDAGPPAVDIAVAALLLRRDIRIEVSVSEAEAEKVYVLLTKRAHPSEKMKKTREAEKSVDAAAESEGAKRILSVAHAEKGVYIFSMENRDEKERVAEVAFRFFEGKARERAKNYRGVKIAPGGTLRLMFVLPDGVFWDDEERFSGVIEDSGTVTKFNSETGFFWKEEKGY